MCETVEHGPTNSSQEDMVWDGVSNLAHAFQSCVLSEMLYLSGHVAHISYNISMSCELCAWFLHMCNTECV